MTHLFLGIYDYFALRKKRLFIVWGLGVVVLAALAFQLRFGEDISGFLPETKENERINRAYRYVVSANRITVFCSGRDTTDEAAGKQMAAVDRLAARLETMEATAGLGYVRRLTYRIDPAGVAEIASFVTRNLPYFLDENDYARMDTLFSRENIARQLADDRRLLTSPAGSFLQESLLADPVRISGQVMARLQGFRTGDRFQLYQDHIFTDDRQALLIIECNMPSSETARNAALLDSLDLFAAETVDALGGEVAFRHFGAAEIGIGNASQIKKDTLLSSLLAAVVILALLLYAFRSGTKILLVFLSTLFGGLFALALLYVIRGEVSVIAVGISSIMFGIAINYPLHFIDRYRHAPHPRQVLREIVEPLTIGNLTTAGAFLSLVFTGSDAMCDLGWFAALLLTGTILFVLILLPHLLPARAAAVATPSLLFRIMEKPFERNGRVVAAVLLLTVFFSLFCTDSRFETDMQRINYMTPEQQAEYERMTNLTDQNRHTLYCVTEGNGLDAALESSERLVPVVEQWLREGKISDAVSISYFYPSQARQAVRTARWNTFWPARRDSVRALLAEEGRKAGFRPEAFEAFDAMTRRTWAPVDMSHFSLIRETLAENYIADAGRRTMIVHMLHTDAARAPELEEALNGQDGDGDAVAFDAGSVTRRMIASLSGNFNYVLFVCGFIVFAFLFFSTGRPELCLIAFAPLALSWVWILGLMNLFDIRFNIVNIILATFIFGQGDDYTIFITEGLMYEHTYRRKILASCKNSIALSALVMFAGIGMLIFARHPALRSLAEVTVVGMLSVTATACILPPFLFRLLTVRGEKQRLMPVTLRNLVATAYSFAVFLVVVTGLTLYGRLIFGLGRATEKKRLAYHRLICRASRWVMYRIPQVKTVCENPAGETFKKPAVIICNHQSHLDLTALMMLTPRLVILTNDWVWNSPFYGRMIRYAEFYPVSAGVEHILDRLQDVVRRGYSIVVFPEGTRSPDCSILRFHRGAFYLAERLQLDIVPVILHGAGHVLPKPEFMLRRGRIHVRIMNRILPDDSRFSPHYPARSREIRRFYLERYSALCREVETPDYYSDLVIHNYLYKGPAVERAVRRSLRRHRNFVAQIALLPDEGCVVVRGSGYGEFTLLAALVRKQLQVIGVEPDDDRRDIASQCTSNPPNLRYVAGDAHLAGITVDRELTAIHTSPSFFNWR